MRLLTKVPPAGDPVNAEYIIVGEQPGQHEVMHRQPFVGESGEVLNKLLRANMIGRNECYLTNVIKDLDQPLQYYIKFTKKGPEVSQAGADYIESLKTELRGCSAKIIIAVGNVALFALTGRTGITKWRGSILYADGIDKWIVPTFHPSTTVYPKMQFENRHFITFDIGKAKELKESNFQLTKCNLIIEPSYGDIVSYLMRCFRQGLTGKYVYYDIEIDDINKGPLMEVSCISFTTETHEAICIPFIGPRGDIFDPEQEYEIWEVIGQILEHPDIKICGQNLSFDCHFLLRKYGIATTNIHDTMVAQRIIMPEFRIGLDMITSLWTDLPYYKGDGKFWLKGEGSWQKGWEYNALDSIACAQAFPKQLEEIKEMENMDSYNRTRKIIPSIVYMMERGVLTQVDVMKLLYESKGKEILSMKAELNKLAGQELNPNSPKQLKTYFYEFKKVKPYMYKGKSTTNELAMKRLSRRGFKEAELVLKIRRTVKERSTYLDTSKMDADNRLRCSYNPVGTVYSRMSSGKNIFGSGNNLQNQPHEILQYFIPDPGYVFYEIDLSQAENRIVAFEGKVLIMIDAFETGKDVHSLTGALISGLDPAEVKRQDKANEYCPLGGGAFTWRFWGKKANHGLNYDFSYRNFSLLYEIPENDGKYIVDSYHAVYPEVRQGFHAYVIKCLMNSRVLTNLMGRKVPFMGDLANSMVRDKIFKKAYACIPQGTVGDIINERGMIFTENAPSCEKLELLMQVHDSIKFQLPLSIGWKAHAQAVIDIKKSLETPLLTHYGREFVIPADLTMGKSMNKKTVKEYGGQTFSLNVSEMADRMESDYNMIPDIDKNGDCA